MSEVETEIETNLAVIGEVEASLAALEAEYAELPDFETDEGYATAKERKRPLVKARTRGDKARLAATKFHRDQVSHINSMWKDDILPRIEALEKPLADGIKAVDDEKARIEREKAEAEQRRIDTHQAKIDKIKALPTETYTLDDVNGALSLLDEFNPDEFEEFSDAASMHIVSIRSVLVEKQAALVKQAEEAKRLEAQRIEQERIAAEQAEKQRLIEEEQRKQREELERQRAELEAEKRKLQEQKEAEERAKVKAELDRKAQEKAEREKAEAAERARQQAIEEERRRVEEEKRKAEQAEAEHQRKLAMAPDAEKLRAWFDSIPAFPEMTSDDGRAQRNAITALLQNIVTEISWLEKEAA